MTIRRDHGQKSRRRHRRSRDKVGAQKLTPRRVRLAEKRRLGPHDDEIFSQE